MKKLIIGIFGLVLIIFYSCSKELIEPDQTGDLKDLTCGKGNLNKPHGPVFTVSPSEDATQALIDAFAAAKEAGPGAVVQLEEGQYDIGMIEVRDFDGYFRGAGKQKTIISNLPDLPCNDWWLINNCPFLLQFVGGDIKITDMTIRIKDGSPCADMPESYTSVFGDMIASVLILADYTTTYFPANHRIDGVVNNVDILSGIIDAENNPYGKSFNVNMSIYCGSSMWMPSGSDPLSSGNITLTGCRFDKNVTGPDFWGFDETSNIKIENNVMAGSFWGVFLGCNLGTNIIVKNNNFKDAFGTDMYIDDSDWGMQPNLVCKKRTEITISGNSFQTSPGLTSLTILDSRRTAFPDEGFPQMIDVKFNTFTTQEGGIAIMGSNFVDAKIWNNRFSGTGTVGVMLDGTEATNTWAENNKVMGNNFSNATYTDANVYLGPYTMNNKVVGVSTDKVIDLGVNNKVIGVKAHKKGPHYIPGKNGHFRNMQENIIKMRSPKTL
jgi:hypothetical protein